MRRIWNKKQKPEKKPQTWYILKSTNHSIEAWFSSFESLQHYWSTLPTAQALTCYWTVHAE